MLQKPEQLLAVLLRSKICGAAKVIGLGILLLFAGFLILLAISLMRITVSFGPSYATGLSAVVAGMIEALFRPITMLVMVVSFVAAVRLTRKTTSKRTFAP